jgi:hypothetical protein
LPFLIVLVLLASCKRKGEPAIQPAQMEKILTDIHIAEAYSVMVNDSLHHIRNKNYDSLAVYYNDIFAHYHVSKEQFIKSIAWYKNNPEDLDSVYAHMLITTGKMEARGGK